MTKLKIFIYLFYSKFAFEHAGLLLKGSKSRALIKKHQEYQKVPGLEWRLDYLDNIVVEKVLDTPPIDLNDNSNQKEVPLFPHSVAENRLFFSNSGNYPACMLIQAAYEVVQEKVEFRNFRTAVALKEAKSVVTSDAVTRTPFIRTLNARLSNLKRTSKNRLFATLDTKVLELMTTTFPKSWKYRTWKWWKETIAVFERELQWIGIGKCILLENRILGRPVQSKCMKYPMNRNTGSRSADHQTDY